MTETWRHPKIISQAQMYASSLTEQQHKDPNSIVDRGGSKGLQGFWVPPPNTCLNMPSQQVCEMAVGVTKAALDWVSTALSSLITLHQAHGPFCPGQGDNCVLFQPRTITDVPANPHAKNN